MCLILGKDEYNSEAKINKKVLWWKQQVSFKYSTETLLGAAIQDDYNKLQRVYGEKILARAISILRITLF